MTLPPTERQLALIHALGGDMFPVYNRFQASMLIEDLLEIRRGQWLDFCYHYR